jgi:hypothetical protein
MSTGCRCWYHLRGLLTKQKKPRHVVWAPAVDAGTTYEVCLQHQKKIAMWYEHRLSVLVPLTRFAYETKKKPRHVVWAPAVGAGTTYEVCLRNQEKSRDVVWSPSAGSGTTYEVCLQNPKIPRIVMPPPAVGAGTTTYVQGPLMTYNTKEYVATWCQHRRTVLTARGLKCRYLR